MTDHAPAPPLLAALLAPELAKARELAPELAPELGELLALPELRQELPALLGDAQASGGIRGLLAERRELLALRAADEARALRAELDNMTDGGPLTVSAAQIYGTAFELRAALLLVAAEYRCRGRADLADEHQELAQELGEIAETTRPVRVMRPAIAPSRRGPLPRELLATLRDERRAQEHQELARTYAELARAHQEQERAEQAPATEGRTDVACWLRWRGLYPGSVEGGASQCRARGCQFVEGGGQCARARELARRVVEALELTPEQCAGKHRELAAAYMVLARQHQELAQEHQEQRQERAPGAILAGQR